MSLVMLKRRFQPELIIGKLHHGAVPLGQGTRVAEAVKGLGATGVAYFRGCQEFGEMSVDQAWCPPQVA